MSLTFQEHLLDSNTLGSRLKVDELELALTLRNVTSI